MPAKRQAQVAPVTHACQTTGTCRCCHSPACPTPGTGRSCHLQTRLPAKHQGQAAPVNPPVGKTQAKAAPVTCPSAVCKFVGACVCYAWESGITPAKTKPAVIAPLCKGTGPRDAEGSHRGISLLSVAG
eukprot:366297-Chlamydomonas_euryale.AAC.8